MNQSFPAGHFFFSIFLVWMIMKNPLSSVTNREELDVGEVKWF